MAIQIKTKYLVYGLILALLSLFLLGWGLGSSKQKKSLTSVVDSLKHEITLSKVQLDKKTVYLAKVSQELTTERELRKKDIVDKETLRKLNLKQVNEISRLKLRMDTLLSGINHTGQIIQIPSHTDSVSNDTITDKKNAILLPFGFIYPDLNKTDPYLNFGGHFDNNGKMSLDSLKMNIDINVFTGLDKTTKEHICILSTANPYIKTIGLASYKTDPPKKKKYGIGLNVGYGLILDKEPHFAPYIGVGFSANIIRF